MKRKASIAGVPITIEITKGPHICEGEVVCGEWVHADRRVVVSGHLGGIERRRTLLHELLHASISILLGCPTMDGIARQATDQSEETFVRMSETGVWTALAENRWLVDYLFNGAPFKNKS